MLSERLVSALDLDAEDSNGYTLLHYAARFDDQEFIDKILVAHCRQGGNLNDFINNFKKESIYGSPVFDACVFGAYSVVSYFLDGRLCENKKTISRREDFKVDLKMTDSASNLYKMTLLIGAAMTGREVIVKAVMDEVKRRKYTKKEMSEYVNHLSFSRCTALSYLAERFYLLKDEGEGEVLNMAEYLINHCAVLNTHLPYFNDEIACINFAEPPIHTAARQGNIKMINLLLEFGASANVLDKYGSTPLHLACLKPSNFELVKLLVEKGRASLFFVNEDGMLPYDMCGSGPEFSDIKNYLKTLMNERAHGANYTAKYISPGFFKVPSADHKLRKSTKESSAIAVEGESEMKSRDAPKPT